MTASPYLVDLIIDLLKKEGLNCAINKNFDPIHKFPVPFLQADKKTQQAMLRENPAYGHVICKCEYITEGDITRALKSCLDRSKMRSKRDAT